MKKIFLFLIILMSLPLINAATIVQVANTDIGLEVEYPKFLSVAQNQNFTLNIHVYNKTDGVNMYSSASCIVDLYSLEGAHICENSLKKSDNNREFELEIDQGNFSQIGAYAYIIDCNTSNSGGFASGSYYVTFKGLDPAGDNFKIFIYALFIFTIVFVVMRLVLTLVTLVTASETIYSVLLSWGSYILLITVYFLGMNYLLASFIRDISGSLLTAVAFTNVFLPLIALVITMIKKGTDKATPINVEEITGRKFIKYG